MEGYNESQDIDALLRSSLRDGQTNPPGGEDSAPKSAEAAARRRRIRFVDTNLDDGQHLCDEQRADEEREALLNAAILESSQTPIASHATA